MKVKEETYLEAFTRGWNRFEQAGKQVNPHNRPWNRYLSLQLSIELDQLRAKESSVTM